jgi:hypothetical protein
VPVAQATELDDVERAICEAIWAQRVIAFTLKGCARVAEPHDFGVVNGQRRLFFFQVGGESRSGPPHGWRWAAAAEVLALRVLERRFPGARPIPSGRHQKWDRLIASVSRPTLVR